jgi:hypothetical protein
MGAKRRRRGEGKRIELLETVLLFVGLHCVSRFWCENLLFCLDGSTQRDLFHFERNLIGLEQQHLVTKEKKKERKEMCCYC